MSTAQVAALSHVGRSVSWSPVTLMLVVAAGLALIAETGPERTARSTALLGCAALVGSVAGAGRDPGEALLAAAPFPSWLRVLLRQAATVAPAAAGVGGLLVVVDATSLLPGVLALGVLAVSLHHLLPPGLHLLAPALPLVWIVVDLVADGRGAGVIDVWREHPAAVAAVLPTLLVVAALGARTDRTRAVLVAARIRRTA